MDLTNGSAWLQHLVDVEKLSFSTQKCALNALVFFYRDVCRMPPEEVVLGVKMQKTNSRIPVVMSRDEVIRVIAKMQGTFQVYARLQYGTGLRIAELLALRIKDLDWDRNQVVIRGGKGDKDRVTMLPRSLKQDLLAIRDAARPWFDLDRAERLPGVKLPNALARKYPAAPESWEWFWMLPSHKRSHDPDCGTLRRHHVHPETYRRAVRKAVEDAGITKLVTPHVLSHVYS